MILSLESEKTSKYIEKSAISQSAPEHNYAMKSDRFSLTVLTDAPW